MMIAFKKQPNGTYSNLSALTPELFDLVVATTNLLESRDISADSFLTHVMDDQLTKSEIVSAIGWELVDLAGDGKLDVPFLLSGGVSFIERAELPQ